MVLLQFFSVKIKIAVINTAVEYKSAYKKRKIKDIEIDSINFMLLVIFSIFSLAGSSFVYDS